MLRFHGSRDKKTFELVGTNSRLDAIHAAALRVFLPQLAGWNDGSRREGGGALRGARARRARRPPVDEPGHVYHMYVVRSPERDRIAAALHEAGISSVAYYVTPLHLQPAMRYLGWLPGSLPETERAAAENLALPLWGCIGADVQERVVDAVRAAVGTPRLGARRVRAPISRHRAWQIAVDAGSSRSRGGSRGRCASTTGLPRPGYYDRYLDWQIVLLVVAIRSPCSSSPGSTTAGGGTSRPATCGRRCAASRSPRSRPSSSSYLFEVHPARVPSGVWFIDLLLCLAFVAGSRLARAHADRAAAAGAGRRPRQGGDRRRGRRRRPARDQGDAAQPALGYTPIGIVDDDPRKRNLRLHGIRVLGTTDDLAAASIRDRRPDEVLIAIPSASGEVRAAHRRRRPRRERRSRQDAARASPSSSAATPTSRRSCAPSRSRTYSGASPSRSTSTRSPATSAARA